MKTVDKAMRVLGQFTLEQTELGLNELARMAELDKAATRRILLALARHNIIEQSQETRKYRLGHGVLRLARIREATVPLSGIAQEVADWLVAQTSETAHISLPGPQGMTTIAYRLPHRGRVITIDPSDVLYYHATASGLAYMANATPETLQRLLALGREKVCDGTITDRDDLLAEIDRTRARGYSRTRNTFEADVASIAMPFFQDGPDPMGTVALALPRNDMTEARREELLPLLRRAVDWMEEALTGT